MFKDKSAPIKASLLNQRLIAGLGNIYVCEALFEAGIRPTRATGSLKRREIERLCEEIKAVLIRAIDRGRLVFTRPPAGDRRTRVLPARLAGLRPRGRTLPHLPAAGRTHRAVESLDILLRCLSAIGALPCAQRSLGL